MKSRLLALSLSLLLLACSTPQSQNTEADFNIAFEKFQLDNGLEVVMHIDRSDPVVAVALTTHVGSAREKEGRTGFAHLFEHLLFLESENLGKGGLDKMSARIGGSGANGSTSRDRTNYFQTVPKDALEKMIWAEADKLGWFINTVTDPVLAKEKQVVKNEKRQGIDNRPYGHTQYVIDKHLYPSDHPYSWQVIGSLEDLQNATLSDVKEFFNSWYSTNNTTLVISGDFEVAQAKEWVRKYFDEIPRGDQISPLDKRAGKVEDMLRLYHEDNFARLPELTLAWPTVELYHADSYPLSVLATYLSQGKSAPLYQQLVEKDQLTSNVRMSNFSSEIAGQAQLSVRTFPEVDLDKALSSIETAFAKFEQEGISQKDLNRIKAGQETRFYNGLSSVLGKGFQLAQYNIFAKDPGFINQDIQNILNVSRDDVMRVYNQYIKGKNYVATSFVPQGKVELALENSNQAEVVEEVISQGAEESFDPSLTASYEPTPSSFDRSVEPPYGTSPEVSIPDVWKEELPNGLKIYGIENNEVPLIQFNIVIPGGQLLEDMEKTGVSNLLASMMTKGTKNKTTEELENAIQQLGASIFVRANRENITISGNTLAKNYDKTMALLEEILLEPRWDEEEFNLAVLEVKSQIQQQQVNPNSVARNNFNKLIYGNNNIRSQDILGSAESVEQISLQDLKNYFEDYLSPSISRMHVVGALDKSKILSSLNGLQEAWEAKEVSIPEQPVAEAPGASKVYFYDIPGAKQSVLRIGYPALAVTDEDYYPATVANYILGGGGFASRLTQELREGKGYTYGINSFFSGSEAKGSFTIGSGVRSNVTLESTQLVKEILADYGQTFTEKDLETTKSFLIKSNARAFETAGAKLGMLQNISTYGWSDDYIKKREEIVKNISLDRIRELSEKYFDESRMYWLVVGDAKTQLERMNDLGFGSPILLNKISLEKE
ncbi:MAG: pitrilysin family protein [Bacteroidia bacterium]|nr:pitrilysin family protein [Bacteroidia bacterium]